MRDYSGSSEKVSSTYSNERLLVQYGFTIPGNPSIAEDTLPTLSDAEKIVYSSYTMSGREQDAVVDAAAKLFADGGSFIERVQNIAPLLGRQVKIMPVKVLLDKISSKLASFPTTLAADYDVCQQIVSKIGLVGDNINDQSRLLTCVRYRIDVKESLTVAELILKYALEMLV
jgi:hypothetical protein